MEIDFGVIFAVHDATCDSTTQFGRIMTIMLDLRFSGHFG